jgi:hypothetical protein
MCTIASNLDRDRMTVSCENDSDSKGLCKFSLIRTRGPHGVRTAGGISLSHPNRVQARWTRPSQDLKTRVSSGRCVPRPYMKAQRSSGLFHQSLSSYYWVMHSRASQSCIGGTVALFDRSRRAVKPQRRGARLDGESAYRAIIRVTAMHSVEGHCR